MATGVLKHRNKIASIELVDQHTAALAHTFQDISGPPLKQLNAYSTRSDALAAQADHAEGSALKDLRSQFDTLAWLFKQTSEILIPLSKEQRTGHLPNLLKELVHRLRVPRKLGTKQVSEAAVQHGKVRRSQGYSFPMIVEESRILQVSIFHTLEKNLSTVDVSLLLNDVMTIADECDSQRKQALISFMEQAAASTA
jgi:hypothetical protein